MRNYEAVVIFYPDVESEEREKVMDRLKSIIESDGSVESVDEWGERKLAYLIDDYVNGYYVLYTFSANPDILTEFERIAKINETVMRHMVVKLDD